MNVKQYARYSLNLFFIITALVNPAIFVVGSIFYPEARLGYSAFLSPPLYGALSMIPLWIMYSPRELTLRQMIFRKFFQLLSLEIILILVTFGREHMSREYVPVILGFAFSVFLVYLTVGIIGWVLDLGKAKSLMKDLEQYQKLELQSMETEE